MIVGKFLQRQSVKYIIFSYLQRGNLPIHHAAMKGHSEVIQILLDAGSEVNTQEKVRKWHLLVFMSLQFLLYSMKIWNFWRVFSNDFISGNEKLCTHLYNLHMVFWYNFQYVHIVAYCKFPILHNCLISWFPFCIKLQEYLKCWIFIIVLVSL